MKKQGNFSRALDELMNGKLSGSDADNGQTAAATAELGEAEALGSEELVPPRPDFTASSMGSVHRIDPRAAEAVITEDMVIKGTLNSSANISIAGTILGDVSSEGDVVVRGKIEGNVTVHSLSIQAGTICGDIISSGTVIIAENSSVDGNVKADRIEINGKVVGNLESATKIILNQRSVIEGNIAAMELSMSEGAELKGNVNVRKTA
ncbi:MAG: bactofilin family protein [Spirochaetales bacterium]